MQQYKIIDLVNFVLKYRRGKAFRGWRADQLAIAFRDAIKKNCLVYSCNDKGDIDGVIVADTSPEYRLLHIENILTTSRGVIKKFLNKYMEWFPGWDIQATRRDKLIRYKYTFRLIQKLQHLT